MVEHVLVVGPPPLLTGDITFEVTECGFEILFPDRISHEHKDLFNELVDWLVQQPGVENLGEKAGG
jgi:hypothetical protein